MKFKTIILIIIAAGAGVLAGKLIFSGAKADTAATETTGDKEQEEQVWTCTMHPQIRQSEPGNCPICGMDLVPLSSLGKSGNPLVFQMTDEAVALANIRTTVVGSGGSNGKSLSLNGRIAADETRSASIVSHIPGRIEKLYISFTGETIGAGQRIATIYSPDLISAQRELLEAAKLSNLSPALLEAARNKLRFWKIPSSTIDKILESGTVQEYFDIYSDHGGVVMKKRVSVGDYISTGEVLYDVQDLGRLWVLFDVYEKDLSNVRVGSSISFKTLSIKDRTFTGKVTFVDPVIDPATRVATARVEMPNSGNALKPDMFVTGSLDGGGPGDSKIFIPSTAVLWTGKRSVVYVKVPGTLVPSYEYREVELGEASGNSYAVNSGLESGDEVVTNGAFVIDAAAQLNNRASMMNGNVALKSDAGKEHLPDFTMTTPDKFKEELTDVVKTYLQLKDALVASDPKSASAFAKEVVNKMKAVGMHQLEEAPHKYWMDNSNTILSYSENIADSGNLEKQRADFEQLSKSVIRAIKVFGISSGEFFIQHCPMVGNNRGGDWVSDALAIRNPYFGDKMMTCGITVDTISYNKMEMHESSLNQ